GGAPVRWIGHGVSRVRMCRASGDAERHPCCLAQSVRSKGRPSACSGGSRSGPAESVFERGAANSPRRRRSEERRVGKEGREWSVTGVQTCALPISGERLFAGLDMVSLGYECVEQVGTPNATHVVLRKA